MSIGWNTGDGGAPTGPAGGDLAGTYPDPEVDGLQGEPVAATAPSEGDVLTFTSGEWTPAAPASGAPSGPASGDLTDSYPGPTVAGIQGTQVNATPPTEDQALVFDGVQWVPTQLGSAQITDPTFTTVALGLEALDALALTVGGKADSDSPIFSGNVDGDGATTFTVPTVAYPNSTTAAASTAFVTAAAAASILPAYYTTAAIGPTISGTGLQTYITVTTPSLAAGTYSVAWSVVSTHTATGSSQGVQMTAGATVVPTATIDGGASTTSGGRTIVQARGFYVHAGGTLALLVQVRRSSGTGNVIPQSGSIELRRVA